MINQTKETLTTKDGATSQVSANRCACETTRYDASADVTIIRADGTQEYLGKFHNARVDAGASAQANNMCGTQVAAFNYLALSSTTLTPAKGDTSLSGEISTNGLGRTAATYGGYVAPSTLGGAASFTMTKTFTATGTSTVNSIALFNASSVGTMFSEINISTATLNANDSLAITYTINI